MSQKIRLRIEFVLGGAGFIVILILPHLKSHGIGNTQWFPVLMILLMVLVCAVFLSAISRMRRIERHKTIMELQLMLKDVATNQLTLIHVNTMLARPISEKHAQNVVVAIENLQKTLGTISDESLQAWLQKYDHTFKTRPQPPIKPRRQVTITH